MTAPAWMGFSALGGPQSMGSRVSIWMEGLRSVPGTILILEVGEERGGPFLRALSPPEILTMDRGRGDPSLRGYWIPPPSPLFPLRGEVFVPGRLVWRGGHSESGTEARPIFPHEEAPWCVQGLFRSDAEGRVLATVRMASAGQWSPARSTLERVGLNWARITGAFYEPWDPSSRAGAIAWEEWGRRSVARFHSGMEAPPSLSRLSSPWLAPGIEANTTRSAGTWRLGWPWNMGRGGTLTDRELLRHACVLGMTGSGKTQYLANLAAEAGRNRIPVALFDLEGDLGPVAIAGLGTAERERFVVIDGARPWGSGRAGVDVVGKGESDRREDLVVAEVLSALRPLSGSSEEFWGPRMERILDSSVRAVWEAGGNLSDVAALLHDPATQAEVLSKGTENERLRTFLGGLSALNRRQPDYLASSQNRLSHVALSNVVRALVAPEGTSVDMESQLGRGGSIGFHLPKGVMGEGPSLFVANMLLASLFLSVSRRPLDEGERVRVLVLLDEVQNFSPALLRAMLETGRKFGIATVFATQSVERFEGLLGASTLGTVGTVVLLRTPPPSAAKALSMIIPQGLEPALRGELERTLTTLPDHTALVRCHGESDVGVWTLPAPHAANPSAWNDCSESSALRFGSREEVESARREKEVDELLLGVAQGKSLPTSGFASWQPAAGGTVGEDDPSGTLATSLRHRWVELEGHGKAHLTPAGWARLGAREESGAPRESDEHRRLVMAAFRIFAMRGVRLEIPAQGRFDLRVPDAVAWVLPDPARKILSAEELRSEISSAMGTWLWRLGRGRNVHVEAEVSSIDDRVRLARSLSKARKAHAHLLFVTGTSAGGRKLRSFLREKGVEAEEATVWVLHHGQPSCEAAGGASH